MIHARAPLGAPGNAETSTRRSCRLPWWRGCVAALGLTACGASPEGGDAPAGPTVTGRVAPAVDGVPSVVLFTPDSSPAPPVPAAPAVLDQFGVAFIPQLLVSRAGRAVEFRNSEEISHNVRVVRIATDSTLFNVGTPMGQPYTHVFEEPGQYAVTCDIHPGMTAMLLVVDAPYAVVADDDGTFASSDVPPGSYTVAVWRAGLERRVERAVRITEGRTEFDLVTPS